MKTYSKGHFRRNILLALGWNTIEFNQGVAEYAQKANWILNDMMCHNGRIPPHWNGNGIVTHINESDEKALISLIRRARVPVVNLGHYTSSAIDCRVIPNNAMIGASAAHHLLGRGFEHFGFFHVNSRPVVVERMGGFSKSVLAAKKQFFDLNYESKIPASLQNEIQYARMLRWLSSQLRKLPKPVGVMAQYDAEANDVVRACLMSNLRIPEDVAVIGVDNDPVYSTLGLMPLTSVDSNRRLAGYRAAETLDQILDGERWPEKTIRINPGGVVVRASTDLVAVEDIHISKALRFIWKRFKDEITLEDIIKASGISRRALYRRFEKIVGHPINKELMNRRLEHAKELLRGTEKKLQFIADESGFGHAQRLSKAFKHFCGTTPLSYRREHQHSKPEKSIET